MKCVKKTTLFSADVACVSQLLSVILKLNSTQAHIVHRNTETTRLIKLLVKVQISVLFLLHFMMSSTYWCLCGLMALMIRKAWA